MPLQVARVALTKTSVGRALLAQPVYDTEIVKAATATTQIRFFSNVLNQADASAVITSKNYGETNLTQSGQLPQGYRFEMHSFNVLFVSDTAGTVLGRTDCDQMTKGAWLVLTISGITVAQLPLIKIPFGIGPDVSTDTNTNRQNYMLGSSHISNKMNMKMGKYNPTIESGESFGATLTWPASITQTVSTRVLLTLNGIYVQPV